MAQNLLQHFEGHASQLVVVEVKVLPSTPAGLSQTARRVLEEPNAGGSSETSEAWAFESLKLMLNATLVATEMEIGYLHDVFPKLCGEQGRTDFAVALPTREVVGVSVTRAFAFKRLFQEEDARYVLEKKLGRILSSTHGCVGRFQWKRQILFVWARSFYDAWQLRKVFEEKSLDAKKADTLVVVAVCPAAHLFEKHRTSDLEVR
eukprot:symbB.v1.2.012721.t2/scaffold885.1/size155274/2